VFDLVIGYPICADADCSEIHQSLFGEQNDCADIVLASLCGCFCLLFYMASFQSYVCEQ
jgi:hypothetical protein